MNYYNKCIYAAILYSSKDKTNAPTDEDLYHMQTQVVVSHLCGNHENCWPDVCLLKVAHEAGKINEKEIKMWLLLLNEMKNMSKKLWIKKKVLKALIFQRFASLLILFDHNVFFKNQSDT